VVGQLDLVRRSCRQPHCLVRHCGGARFVRVTIRRLGYRVAMEERASQVDEDNVRAALIERYERLMHELATEHRAWTDRIDALRDGEITVEPGWMLRPILGDSIETFGLYRVYPDGRIERDRRIEGAEANRFRQAGQVMARNEA